jgi:transposase, IS30 family
VYHHLSAEERHSIAILKLQGLSERAIARALGRSSTTIHRELTRNVSTHDGFYRHSAAGELYRGRLRRSRRNQQYGPDDYADVERLIRDDLSPQQIVGRAKREGVAIMSHDTIYRWIRSDKKRGGSLYLHLRHLAKNCRKRYRGKDSRGRLAGKRMISERPAVVESRSRRGDWEIDTIHGKGKSCLVTAVERKTGLVRIGPVQQATAELTEECTVELLGPLQVHTITSDNGTEFHGYKTIEERLGATFYFANPHHAWERGTNENTNGLIRQYANKGTSLAHLTKAHCLTIEERLNNRPRLRLGFLTPNEAYFHSNQIASCGKLFGSCPRKRSNRRTYKPVSDALQI